MKLDQESMSSVQKGPEAEPALWRVAAPVHFDSAIAWWVKLLVMLGLLGGAFYVDEPVARWVFAHEPLRVMQWGAKAGQVLSDDTLRELTHLEQFGQVVCSVVVIGAVALIDKAGRRKALALAIACGVTCALSHLLKDVMGRGRPNVFFMEGFSPHYEWGHLGFLGLGWGFDKHYAFGSFPSAHTTGAFALACGLAWFYPRGRGLFMGLAVITAVQRILHHEHFVSDTVAGVILAVGTVRLMLGWNVAGRMVGWMPAGVREWWMRDGE